MLKYMLGLIAIMASATSAAEPVALFNGKDFSGWKFEGEEGKVPKLAWSVKEGILVSSGDPAGVIRTEKDYRDYELVLEWRWPDAPGNSGLLLHCTEPGGIGPWPHSIEAQLMAANAGDFVMIKHEIEGSGEKKGIFYKKLAEDAEKPAGEWNTMRVMAKGDRIVVWVNDTKVNEGKNCSVSKGAICLQSEGSPIEFRKVELTPLAKE